MTHQLHTDQEVVLMLDQELQDMLREHMVPRPHSVDWVRQHAWLENQRQVCASAQ